MKVFVYGTLKMGYWNNRLLRDKQYVGDAVVEGYMLKNGGFPFALPDPEGKVKGEVWDIGDDKDCLLRLDQLEGHPDWYLRTPVKTLDGQDVEIYVYQDPFVIQNRADCPVNAKGEYYWEDK